MSADERPRIAKAIEALRGALERNPCDVELRYALAGLLALAGDRKEALHQLEQAERLGLKGSFLRRWLDDRGSEDLGHLHE